MKNRPTYTGRTVFTTPPEVDDLVELESFQIAEYEILFDQFQAQDF
jgi:hypothetical protein